MQVSFRISVVRFRTVRNTHQMQDFRIDYGR